MTAGVHRDAGNTAFAMQSSDGAHVITVLPIAGPQGGYQSCARCTCSWASVQLFGHMAYDVAQQHLKAVSDQ